MIAHMVHVCVSALASSELELELMELFSLTLVHIRLSVQVGFQVCLKLLLVGN